MNFFILLILLSCDRESSNINSKKSVKIKKDPFTEAVKDHTSMLSNNLDDSSEVMKLFALDSDNEKYYLTLLEDGNTLLYDAILSSKPDFNDKLKEIVKKKDIKEVCKHIYRASGAFIGTECFERYKAKVDYILDNILKNEDNVENIEKYRKLLYLVGTITTVKDFDQFVLNEKLVFNKYEIEIDNNKINVNLVISLINDNEKAIVLENILEIPFFKIAIDIARFKEAAYILVMFQDQLDSIGIDAGLKRLANIFKDIHNKRLSKPKNIRDKNYYNSWVGQGEARDHLKFLMVTIAARAEDGTNQYLKMDEYANISKLTLGSDNFDFFKGDLEERQLKCLALIELLNEKENSFGNFPVGSSSAE